MKTANRIKGSILGLATGDALGVPVEFTSREERRRRPVTGMTGEGTYSQPPGTWSDDTSLTLALLDSLTEGYDPKDAMNRFVRWWERAEYTATGVTFDIGRTTELALRFFRNGAEPMRCGGRDERDNGNGGLMRILPQVLYELCDSRDLAETERLERIYEMTALTHAHRRSLLASGIYYFIMKRMFSGTDSLMRQVQGGINDAREFYRGKREWVRELSHFERLFDISQFAILPEDQIRSSGYVVDTLEAAVWCLLRAGSFEECVLTAVNLGEDTDTVAAVAGSMAGMYYGVAGIPERWLDVLARREWIEGLCAEFAEAMTGA